ncbi:12595_t:CDS:2 [Gigaspora margarita]|uniref:12595_t:CDS:1 n=1 Tax=Gigaspora margarita TaxID=4874 RepID=A0ABN7UKG3_GIGMA|nr:12595_t:CDS:2 [Gigaspora margarita]
MKYIATWCPANKQDILPSIYRWPITKGKLKFDKHYIIYNSINLDAKALIGVSDMNHIILRVEDFVKDSYNFELSEVIIIFFIALKCYTITVNEKLNDLDKRLKNIEINLIILL